MVKSLNYYQQGYLNLFTPGLVFKTPEQAIVYFLYSIEAEELTVRYRFFLLLFSLGNDI